VHSRLGLTRQQILAFRRRVGGLEKRLPAGSESLQRAARAGLQDSMPRAALLSLHARVEGVEPSSWEDPCLAQLWGLRYSAYVVAKRDFALFSLGRYPSTARGRERAEEMAARLKAHLNGARMTDREVGRALGINPNALRYAAPTGTVAIRWDGARASRSGRSSLPRSTRPRHAASSLAATCTSSGRARRRGSGAGRESNRPRPPRRSPRSKDRSWPSDRQSATRGCSQTTSRPCAPRRSPTRPLPSGDAYFLLAGTERELLVPREELRSQLWTPRVWPGAVPVEGEIRGTWRRAQHTVRIDTWERLSQASRDAVEAEAAALPLPDIDRPIEVVWNT
jgi:hypothetical protein